MFQKSLTTIAAIALLSAPLSSYAQPAPVLAPPPQAQGPAAAPRGPGLETAIVVGALVVLAGLFARRH
ncbi:hypothetical protein [Albirhodobacter sp. R86504]|jgi:hypothetical protein|uniref:hypothetical protein n=1 Tax=Albirhodobacter sp. R86504 TaxID=3093848 RepID=UPI0036710DBD